MTSRALIASLAVLAVLAAGRARAQTADELASSDVPAEAPAEERAVSASPEPAEAASTDEAPAETSEPAATDPLPAAEAEGGASEGGAEAATDTSGEDEAEDQPLDLSFDLPVFGHTTFSMTSTTTARYRGGNYDANPYDDDFASIRQRFDIALQGDELRFELRLDGFLPFGFAEGGTSPYPYYRPGWIGSEVAGAIGHSSSSACPMGLEQLCTLAWDVRPERLTLRWEHESWVVEAGDAQLVFGRGVALSFRKVDLLGVDNALRGGHVRYDDGHFRARIHAGVANPQNQDPITLTIVGDPVDVFAAGSVGATFGPGDAISASLHAVRAWFEDCYRSDCHGRSGQTADIAGWTLEAPALADGNLALYAEANGMRRQYVFDGETRTEFGRAVYASAQLIAENLTVLVEWKDYTNFLLAPSADEPDPWRIYNAAPSLEFDGPQRLRGIGNQRGGSVRLDYGFLPGPWAILLGSSLYGLDSRPEYHDPWNGVLVTHTWAGLTRRQEYEGDLTWSITTNGGYRREMCLEDNCEILGEHSGDVDREMIHGQVELTLASGDHGFDLTADHRYEGERVFGGFSRFQIGGVSLTYTFGVVFAVTLGLRWTDQVGGIVAGRNARDYNFLGSRAANDLSAAGAMYPSLELRYNPDPSNSVRLFVGQTPGGLICSGGVCRQVPPFEGGLLELVLRL